MTQYTPLLTILVAAFGLAFVLGYLAYRLKISPVVGYLLTGILIGPFTPGYTADPALASELAEIGIILLMFGVGLHFSLSDLRKIKNIAIPGALVQIIIATLLSTALGYLIGWDLTTGLVYGLALSVASTVVLLRTLEELKLLTTTSGRIAVGWLIVEDLAVIFILIFLPPIAAIAGHTPISSLPFTNQNFITTFFFTVVKIAMFIAIMLIFGRRLIPRILDHVAHKGSSELFRLAVLAIALVVAFSAAKLFGVSFAIGAFFAGMFLSESKVSHRAAEETLPLREAFSVLFFVSVGILFHPATLIQQPFLVLMTVIIIIVGKSLIAFLIAVVFRYKFYTAVTIAIALAQIGEFSFILAEVGYKLGMISELIRNLILAGAFISMILNPFLFRKIHKKLTQMRLKKKKEAISIN